jgi:hypothetical protein
MTGRQRHELLASAIVERVLDYKKPARPFLSGDLEGRFNVKCRTGAHNIYLSFDHACRFLQLAQPQTGSRIRRVDQHTKPRGSRIKLVQKLQTLGLQFRSEKAHARYIAALERLVGKQALELEFLKGALHARPPKRAYIRDHRPRGLSVAERCRLMGIARSTYYDRSEKPADDTAIVEAIATICDEFEHYGWRRVQAALRQQGLIVNHKKIRRLMREHDLQPRLRRRFTVIE